MKIVHQILKKLSSRKLRKSSWNPYCTKLINIKVTIKIWERNTLYLWQRKWITIWFSHTVFHTSLQGFYTHFLIPAYAAIFCVRKCNLQHVNILFTERRKDTKTTVSRYINYSAKSFTLYAQLNLSSLT